MGRSVGNGAESPIIARESLKSGASSSRRWRWMDFLKWWMSYLPLLCREAWWGEIDSSSLPAVPVSREILPSLGG